MDPKKEKHFNAVYFREYFLHLNSLLHLVALLPRQTRYAGPTGVAVGTGITPETLRKRRTMAV